uniref:ribosomal protein L23 n=1 Tax=Cephaleuros lagerheimii TaxID=2738443 RepID=UPI0030034557
MTNFIKSFIFNNKGIISIFYILHVDSKLKKPEIKKFCQEILNTPVVYVNTLNLPPKKRHLKMKRAFVKFIGTKDTTNPLKNFMQINSLSTSSTKMRSDMLKFNNKKKQENREFKTLPFDLETRT